MKHPIFVVEYKDHNLIFGQPFLNSVKFCQEYKPDNIFSTITYLQTQQSAIFQTLAHQDPSNQTDNQIFFNCLN